MDVSVVVYDRGLQVLVPATLAEMIYTVNKTECGGAGVKADATQAGAIFCWGSILGNCQKLRWLNI